VTPRWRAAHICLGWVFGGTGRSDQALVEYRKGLDLEPTNDTAYAGLGYVYEQLDQLDAAEKTFKQAIAMRPQLLGNVQLAWSFLHASWRATRRPAAMYSQVVSLAPDSFTGYYNLGGRPHLAREIHGSYSIAASARCKSAKTAGMRTSQSGHGPISSLHRYADSAAAFEQATQA